MSKLLLAIMLLVTGVKFTAERATLAYKYDLAKQIEQDEDDMKEKSEQGKSKYDNDDKYFHHSILSHSPFNAKGKSLKIVCQADVYVGFVAGPVTPPPDRL